MDFLLQQVVNLLVDTYPIAKDIVGIVALACLLASAIVRLTPTLKDDNALLPAIKFIGRFIALNKYGPNGR